MYACGSNSLSLLVQSVHLRCHKWYSVPQALFLVQVLDLAREVDAVGSGHAVGSSHALVEVIHPLFELFNAHEEVWFDGDKKMSNVCRLGRIIRIRDMAGECTP